MVVNRQFYAKTPTYKIAVSAKLHTRWISESR